ncbi:hypothetical protein Q1695_014027 [Nippostrongylus brasiliensis]|nr:hypothetical protein Q1695_014027 [Nippostrongylus brasiliensis]
MAICLACVGVWISVASAAAYFLFFRKSSKELRKQDWKKDVVYLYQFPRSPTVPNVSPFCLKVETFLRVNKIAYEVCPLTMGRSQYGLLPFVELNGEHIADSQVIVNRLTKYFSVKAYKSAKDAAVARTVCRTADIHTFMVNYKFKLVDNANNFVAMLMKDLGCPSFLLPLATALGGYMMKQKATKRIAGSVGQLSDEDYKELLRMDLDAYRDILGDQKYLFGDEITPADCTLFGQLATTLYVTVDTYGKEVLKEHYPSLVAYCERIKTSVFGNDFAEK